MSVHVSDGDCEEKMSGAVTMNNAGPDAGSGGGGEENG